MKRYSRSMIIAAHVFICIDLSSQTLTCAYNCPQPGQMFSMKTSSPVAATPGQNQVWNFTQVQAVSAGVQMVSYLTPTSAPSANTFTQANVAKLQSGNYTFLETGPGGVKLSTAANVTVNAQANVLPLPFYFGSSSTETIHTSYYSGTTLIEAKTSKKLNGTGTGTLILPTGTYTDVLLITGQTVESRTIAGAPEGNIVTNNFSYFYSEKISHPLLYTEYKWETGPNDYSPYTEFIADLYTSITSEPKEDNQVLVISPNPASDFIHVNSTTSAHREIFVIDALGETVQRQEYSGGRMDLDLRNLPVGLYTLVVTSPGGLQYKKLLVNR